MKRFLNIGILLGLCTLIRAQISPPALSNTNTSTWLAVGLRQDMDSLSQKQSMTYFGLGTISHPSNYNPFQKRGILIINEEFYHQFRPHWQYSVALSYRRQDEYTDTPPYGPEPLPLRQELRLYGRFSYIWKNPRLRFAATFRQDFRKFYTPDFHHWEETFQLRSRLRSHLSFNLDLQKVHRIIVSGEALFAVSRSLSTKSWGDFRYRDARLCLYYSLGPEQIPFTFNFGYMHNLVGTGPGLHHGHYFALDVIWENPLHRLKRRYEPRNDDFI